MKYLKYTLIAVCVINTVLAIFDGRMAEFFNK
jgi:hypothetical protein